MAEERVAPERLDGSEQGPDARYCYRCKSLLKHRSEWCGTCGADQFYRCRSCGQVFSKARHRCPECGARRRRSSHRSGISRVSTSPATLDWLNRHRHMLFYVAAGVTGGILLGAIIKALASHSGPANEQGYSLTSIMYWLDPFIRAARTVWHLISEAVSAVFRWTRDLILNNFKTTVLAFLGGLAGFIVAIRDKRRRHRKRKHRNGGEAPTEDTGTKA
ncbi:MAG: hypothetical protein QUS11_03560 [Candidatus Fermentibacter sp.]|nr:hypothetical protein [Candidatus Fermentibacter sp.]